MKKIIAIIALSVAEGMILALLFGMLIQNRKKRTAVIGSAGAEETAETVGTDVSDTESESVTENETASPEETGAESVTETETEAEPEPEPEKRFTLVMVGDMLLHEGVENSAKTEEGYDYSAIFSHTKELISAADLAVVNQEVVIAGEELGIEGYPYFNAPFSFADELVKSGFDVVCHATNHALDRYKEGLLICLGNWREKYPQITVVGIHDTKESYESVTVKEVNGIKVAILNFTYGTNSRKIPSDMKYCVDLLTEKHVTDLLIKAETEADITVVCPHWGTEYKTEPNAEQKKWAKLFVKYGADICIGTHPHVIQPIEVVKDEKSGNEMLTYWSLGNFVNWTSAAGKKASDRMGGGMATVEVKMEDTAKVVSYGVVPLICHVEEGPGGVTVYPIDDYSEELAEKSAFKKQDSRFSLDYMKKLFERVWGEAPMK